MPAAVGGSHGFRVACTSVADAMGIKLRNSILKGSFCQPRPQAWVKSTQAAGLGKLAKTKFEPEGLVLRDRPNVERPLTGPRQSRHPLPRPAAWADRTGLS